MNATFQTKIRIGTGHIAVQVTGEKNAPPVLLSHSILSSGDMWAEQAALLTRRGLRVICADTRGHGKSSAPQGPYEMDDLVADAVAVLDALDIERVHLVGLSLGGMMGFGLGILHPERVASLVLCDARADAPPAFAAPWDERIRIASSEGCAALAVSTTERWFGKPFVDAHSQIATRFREGAGATSVEGFVGCARAIQGLDYLSRVGLITAPTTLIVGANDGPLPQAMADIQKQISGAMLEVIPGAGHLPNIDQPEAFNAALLRHFFGPLSTIY
jgi:3-oxoadipate enol-lactonase